MLSKVFGDVRLISEIDDEILKVARIDDIPNTDLQAISMGTAMTILRGLHKIVREDVLETLEKYREQAEGGRIDSDELLKNIIEDL